MTGLRWAHLPDGKVLHKPSCYTLTVPAAYDEPHIVGRAKAQAWMAEQARRKLCGVCKPSDPRLRLAP